MSNNQKPTAVNGQNPNATSVQSVSYSYEGNAIKFFVNGKIMVCATEMAKPFGKKPVDWLRFQQSQEFIDELSKVRNHTLADLVIVRKGGSNPGTWFHEDVAIEFARWLSPRFGIWCNDRVKEVLQGRLLNAQNCIFCSDKDRMIAAKDREIERLQFCYSHMIELAKSMHESNRLAHRNHEMLFAMKMGGVL